MSGKIGDVRELLGLPDLEEWELDQKLLEKCVAVTCSVGSPSNQVRIGLEQVGLGEEKEFLKKWSDLLHLYLVPKDIHQKLTVLANACRQVFAPSSPYVLRTVPQAGQNSPKLILFKNISKVKKDWEDAVAALEEAVENAVFYLDEYKFSFEQELRGFLMRINTALPQEKRLSDEEIDKEVARFVARVPSPGQLRGAYYNSARYGWSPSFSLSYEDNLKDTLAEVGEEVSEDAELLDAILAAERSSAEGMLEDTLQRVYGGVRENCAVVLERIQQKGVVGKTARLEDVLTLLEDVGPCMFEALGTEMDPQLAEGVVPLKAVLDGKSSPESVRQVLQPLCDRAEEVLAALM